ncbi:uncharacterized protein LOC113366820 [Ctenocephalides felis]|uniref:uncharacterized protein LOC113366820 n=1 Tax=Ctenocephalides felis TaxID=7515 RepID=UPI000E6E262C|nr:uncharacterized protein LOC113366820 [Ctenocephalides felis]
MTMKLQLAATMEEEKNTSNEIKQKILKESFDEYTNKAKECSSRLKTDIIEKRGKEKLSEINKDNADLKLKLQAATDSKDNMNLKLCQMESITLYYRIEMLQYLFVFEKVYMMLNVKEEQ